MPFSGNGQNSHELLQFQKFGPRFGLAAMKTWFKRDLGWVPFCFIPNFVSVDSFLNCIKCFRININGPGPRPLAWQPHFGN